MEAIVVAPPDLPKKKWEDEPEEVADRLNVDLEVSVYKD